MPVLNEDRLKACYEKLRFVTPVMESYDVVKKVEEYRTYWKPQDVKIVLLAESHVHTPQAHFSCKLNKQLSDKLDLAGCPQEHVNFVYCLSYGENEALTSSIEKNVGTPSFWKLFAACCYGSAKEEILNVVLKTKNRRFVDRIKAKVAILNRMKNQGIWLVDSSVVGIYGAQDNIQRKEAIIRTSWRSYVSQAIQDAGVDRIFVIGKEIGRILGEDLSSGFSWNENHIINSPTSFISKGQRRGDLKKIANCCAEVL